MTDQEIFDHYIRMAETIGKMFSPLLETVVHDLRIPEKSIIYICNNHITGRKLGDSLTDLGLRRLIGDNVPDMLISYPNESPSGQRLKSSSLTIRNQEGKIIGAFCLNLALENFEQMKTVLDQFLIFTEPSDDIHFDKENFITSPVAEIRKAIDDFRQGENHTSYDLSKENKQKLIQYLYTRGYFNIRGAVAIIARQVGLTKASVYNYLKKIDKTR